MSSLKRYIITLISHHKNLSLPNLQNILLNHLPYTYHSKISTPTKTSPPHSHNTLNHLLHSHQRIITLISHHNNLSPPNLQNILLNHPPRTYHPKLTTPTKTSPLTLTTQLNQLQHFWQHITIPYRLKISQHSTRKTYWHTTLSKTTPHTPHKPIVSKHIVTSLPYTSHTKLITPSQINNSINCQPTQLHPQNAPHQTNTKKYIMLIKGNKLFDPKNVLVKNLTISNFITIYRRNRYPLIIYYSKLALFLE